MHPVDHMFMLLLFVALPVYGWLQFLRYLGAVEAGKPPRRRRLYFETACLQWISLAVLLAAWALLARPFPELGFLMPGGAGFWWSLLAGVAVVGYLLYSARQLRALSTGDRAKYRRQLGDLQLFLPQTDRELRWFYGLSVTAGVVEEIIFRGFVLWYLGQFMPLWAAALVSSMGFGLGHSYQGPGGMLKTGAAGLVFAVLYIVSGSIWLPIVLHALFDILQDYQLRELYRGTGGPGEAQSSLEPAAAQ